MRLTFNDFSELKNSDPMKNFLPINKKKESCFNCFKLFLEIKKITFSGKILCSNDCKNSFEEINMVDFF